MKNKFILGGGISGLVYAFYNKEYKIISKNVGGKLSNNFMKNTILLHETPETIQLLKDLDIEIKKKTHLIKYVKDDVCKNNINVADKVNFIKKKMDDDNFNVNDVKLSTNDYYISILEVDMTEIIEKLKTNTTIIDDEVIRITDSSVITKTTKYDYDELVSTIPAPIFWRLWHEENDLEFEHKPTTFVLCDSIPEVLINETFDLAYFVDKKYKYTRINKKGDNYLYEFTGKIEKVEIQKLLPENAKILEHYIDDYSIIFDNKNNIPPSHIYFLGRFSVYSHGYKIQDAVKFANWSYNFKNIWNIQKSFSSKIINFNKLTTVEQKEKLSQDFVLHLLGELGEVLEATNYKKHKQRKKVDVKNITEECIDIFKYLLNILLVWDVDVKKFVQIFEDKSKLVEERLRKEFKENE